MKRNFILAAILLSAFTGVSCEKHSWEDQVEIIEETETDDDGNVTVVKRTKVVPQDKRGAVRFFKEDHSGDHADHANGEKNTDGDH